MMISQLDLKQLSAPQRAQLIYSQARSELSSRLWRAALGSDDDRAGASSSTKGGEGIGLDALLALLDPDRGDVTAGPPMAQDRAASGRAPDAALPDTTDDAAAGSGDGAHGPGGLGPNAKYEPALASAASRTGIPAPALAAIVHAEAAKGRHGDWQLLSRNPRSSAAGLGQFLSGTWKGLAEAKGTWLNGVARDKGWIDGNGRVVPAALSSLLSLRYDADASINTIADYARQNLNGLKRAGVAIGNAPDEIARSAYLGHHLGLGDAVRFVTGGLDPARARTLLDAQIGRTRANEQIARAGCPAAAHRAWFLAYVNRNVQPGHFTA